MDNLYIARQPIFDSKLHVFAYEILYRNSEVNQANIVNAEQATRDAILNAFMHIGIDNLTGTALAFINLPKSFLVNMDMPPMFHNQTVLEILEDVEVSQDVIKNLKHLKQKGFKIALDDFLLTDKHVPFLELADFVKIDVLNSSKAQIENIIEASSKYPAILIAEKVETEELYQYCRTLPFKYYQGFFFSHPQLLKHKQAPSNKAVVLKLLNELLDKNTDFNKLEMIISQDVALSYKLLRYISSAAFSLRREINSIKDAMQLLGLNTMKNWVSLILLSRIAENKPQELVVSSLVRAIMMDFLANHFAPEHNHQVFITGLFSHLDALMDQPMIDLLDTVTLSSEIKFALLDHDGELGQLLSYVEAYERGEFDNLAQSNIDNNLLSDAYLEAVKWADNSIKAIGSH